MFLKILGTLAIVAGLILFLFAASSSLDAPRMAIKIGFAAMLLWVTAFFLIGVTSIPTKQQRRQSSKH